jgi:hypothetical protein
MFVLRNIILVILIVALSLATGCGRTVTSEQFNESYQVRSGTVIDVYNRNGSVTIIGSEQDKIEISAVKESYQGQSALDQVDIFIDIAEKLTISTVSADENVQVTIDFKITVPRDLFIGTVEGSNGDISVEDVIGSPLLTTSNGSITVNNVNGIVSASSSNGNITILGVRSLEAVETSNGNIEAELPTLHDDLIISTSNGSVKLALNPNLQATIEAETSNGSIEISNLNISEDRLEQNAFSGQMNDGGYNIGIFTSNGSIELTALK